MTVVIITAINNVSSNNDYEKGGQYAGSSRKSECNAETNELHHRKRFQIVCDIKRNRKKLDIDEFGAICGFIKEDPNRFIGTDAEEG